MCFVEVGFFFKSLCGSFLFELCEFHNPSGCGVNKLAKYIQASIDLLK